MRQRLESCLRVAGADTFENTFFDRSKFANRTTEVSSFKSGCDLKSAESMRHIILAR